MSEFASRRINEPVKQANSEPTNQWINASMSPQLNDSMNELFWAPWFLCFFEVQSKCLEKQRFLHILPTWSSKSAPSFRGAKPRKQRPYTWQQPSRSHISKKKTRVSRQRVFSPVNSHVFELLHFPTLDDGRLTWWCGWHTGGNADHDDRPQLRSVPTKLPLNNYPELPNPKNL